MNNSTHSSNSQINCSITGKTVAEHDGSILKLLSVVEEEVHTSGTPTQVNSRPLEYIMESDAGYEVVSFNKGFSKATLNIRWQLFCNTADLDSVDVSDLFSGASTRQQS